MSDADSLEERACNGRCKGDRGRLSFICHLRTAALSCPGGLALGSAEQIQDPLNEGHSKAGSLLPDTQGSGHRSCKQQAFLIAALQFPDKFDRGFVLR